MGKATLKVERVCALLDPRRKSLNNSQILNGSAALRTRAEEDLKALIETFADEHTPSPAPLAGVVGGKPGDRGTRTQEEEAFENGGEACGTCGRCSCW